MLNQIIDRLLSTIRRPSPLSDNGERIDIDLRSKPFNLFMDVYQRSHYHRYRFARRHVGPGMVCGDFACGTGYGTVLLAERARRVVGMDINARVINAVAQRYADRKNVEFACRDLTTFDDTETYDRIVSFETIEHLKEEDAIKVLHAFARALKPGGLLIFSTPYLQERTPVAVEMGFHLTFDIDEQTLAGWLEGSGLSIEQCFYQNYASHQVVPALVKKDFIICMARKPAADL